jgi:ribosomal-protein-alanine N-acetyltransferase
MVSQHTVRSSSHPEESFRCKPGLKAAQLRSSIGSGNTQVRGLRVLRMDILETKRLILRHTEMSDLENLLGILADPEAMRYYPSTKDEATARMWIERTLERYKNDGTALWTIDLKAEPRIFIGQCGLVRQEVQGNQELEVGYLLLRRYWGYGFATEAAAACRDYGFDVLGADRLISIINPENLASRRVAERIGMHVESNVFWKSQQVMIHAIDRGALPLIRTETPTYRRLDDA